MCALICVYTYIHHTKLRPQNLLPSVNALILSDDEVIQLGLWGSLLWKPFRNPREQYSVSVWVAQVLVLAEELFRSVFVYSLVFA